MQSSGPSEGAAALKAGVSKLSLLLLCMPLSPLLWRAGWLCPTPILSCSIRGDSKDTYTDGRPPESVAMPAREASPQWAAWWMSTSELREGRRYPGRWEGRCPCCLPRGDLLQQASDFLIHIRSAQKGFWFIQKQKGA